MRKEEAKKAKKAKKVKAEHVPHTCGTRVPTVLGWVELSKRSKSMTSGLSELISNAYCNTRTYSPTNRNEPQPLRYGKLPRSPKHAQQPASAGKPYVKKRKSIYQRPRSTHPKPQMIKPMNTSNPPTKTNQPNQSLRSSTEPKQIKATQQTANFPLPFPMHR